MIENIEPTTILKEGEKYKLIDKDYLLIVALGDLTKAIERLRLSL